METFSLVKTLSDTLVSILNATFESLHHRITQTIDSNHVPFVYICSLPKDQQLICYHFILLVFLVTYGWEAPREVQLCAALASYECRDCVVIAGTGSGKTLIIALLILIDNLSDGITITVSPLKRLQLTQVHIFNVFLLSSTNKLTGWWLHQ